MKKSYAGLLVAVIIAVQLHITMPGSMNNQDMSLISALLGSTASNPLTALVTANAGSDLQLTAESSQVAVSPAPEPVSSPESYAPRTSPPVSVSRHKSAATAPVATASSSTDTYVIASSQQAEMLAYINAARKEANLAPVVLSQALSAGAALKSQDMAVNGYFAHTSPTYGKVAEMMDGLGIDYRIAAENIAKNYSVKNAQEAFMESPGHRNNILNPAFSEVGLGFYQVGNYLFVTQWFTN